MTFLKNKGAIDISCSTADGGGLQRFRAVAEISISIQEYLGTLNGSGSFQFLYGFAENNKSPYMAIFDDVFVIGPLIVHHRSDGRIHAINSEQGMVSGDIDRTTAGQAREQFAAECGPQKAGSYLWLWNMRAYNIWHWTMESLTKVMMAEESGFDGYYIIPEVSEKSGYIYESLELIGIAANRIKTYDGKPWRVERLYLPETMDGNRQIAKFPKIISMLRQKLLNACPSLSCSFDRVYIARDNPNFNRRIVNELELMEVLFKYGFQRVVMENYTFKEQITIAAGANCLVAPHGAGMVHCLFMKPQSLVIELFPTTYINPCMLPVIDHLQHRYFMIPSHHNSVYENDNYGLMIYPIEVTLKREIGKSAN